MPDLTEKFIASLKPREGRKQYDVYDSKLPLGLCYSNGGARTFFVFWRDVEGKKPPHEYWSSRSRHVGERGSARGEGAAGRDSWVRRGEPAC